MKILLYKICGKFKKGSYYLDMRCMTIKMIELLKYQGVGSWKSPTENKND